MFTPGERDLLLVNFYNHVPNAERIATEAEVRWAGPKPMATAIEELRAPRRARRPRGDDRPARLPALRARSPSSPAAGPARRRLHAPAAASSPRRSSTGCGSGCELTDDAVRALHGRPAPGHRRARARQPGRARVRRPRRHDPHPLLRRDADGRPGLSVPAQCPPRGAAAGDVADAARSAPRAGTTPASCCGPSPSAPSRRRSTASSTTWPTRRSTRCSRVLRPGATAADLVEASAVIEDAGFTTRDDLVHGFVGGYLPPVLGDATRTLEEVPDFTLRGRA